MEAVPAAPPAEVPQRTLSGAPANGRRVDDRTLLRRHRRHGDLAARDELIERFLPLARRLALRYHHSSEPIDDLTQVASIGLMKAVDRFDPDRGTAFSTFAVPTILGELKRYFRDAGWAVHVPRGTQERVLQVGRAVSELSGRLGRSPQPAEVAREIGASTEQVLEAMEAGTAYESGSLDAPTPGADGDEDGYPERVGHEDGRYELVEYGASIAPALEAMPERERTILHLRFNEDLTQSEIAARIGISQMHVSRLIRRAIASLRDAADENDAAAA